MPNGPRNNTAPLQTNMRKFQLQSLKTIITASSHASTCIVFTQ